MLQIMLFAVLMITPEQWNNAAASIGKEKVISFARDNGEINSAEKIDKISTYFEDIANSLISDSRDEKGLSVYTFVIDAVNGNSLRYEDDNASGYSYVSIPKNLPIFNINSTTLGNNGRKVFSSIPVSALSGKTPFIIGIIGKTGKDSHNGIHFNVIRQVFYLGHVAK